MTGKDEVQPMIGELATEAHEGETTGNCDLESVSTQHDKIRLELQQHYSRAAAAPTLLLQPGCTQSSSSHVLQRYDRLLLHRLKYTKYLSYCWIQAHHTKTTERLTY